jgi:hypothetical protein
MRKLLLVVAAVAALSVALPAQDKGGKGGGKGKAANPPPQNLQILTPENFRPLMTVFVESLGVANEGGCMYCHVQGQMALDDKPPKKTARAMIAMVRELNEKNFEGQQRVTCYTCHRGSPKPATQP